MTDAPDIVIVIVIVMTSVGCKCKLLDEVGTGGCFRVFLRRIALEHIYLGLPVPLCRLHFTHLAWCMATVQACT